jgi:hypothetical protein
MAEHVWSVLCTKSIVDSKSNQLTLVEAIQRINVNREQKSLEQEMEKHGGFLFPMELVSLWVRTDPEVGETTTAKLTLSDPTSGVRREWITSVDLESHSSMRLRYGLEGVPWGGAGRYWLVVSESIGEGQWKIWSRVPLEIKINESPAVESGGRVEHID